MKLLPTLAIPTILLAVALFAQAANPVPSISNPLVPAAATPGSSGFTLAVNGTGFVSGSVVNWDGNARPTTFVTATRLTATISSSDVSTATTATVTVTSPGGESSDPAYFEVATPASAIGIGQTIIPTPGGQALKARDINNDGKLDIISIGSVSSNNEAVVVQLGNGDGTFQAPIVTPLGQPASDMVVGDFNNDGKLDVALEQLEVVYVLFGNGDGTFQSPISTDFFTRSITSFIPGDFNGDGKLDLALGLGTSVGIMLGNGDGTFRVPTTFYSTGTATAFSLAVGDFNLDGKLDLATNASLNSVAVLLGNGDGTFQNSVAYTTANDLYNIVVADVNGDGKPDLVVNEQGQHGASNISRLLGNGDGTFQTHVDQVALFGSTALTAADFNGDGKLDVATNSPSVTLVQTMFGKGDGSFSQGGYFPDGPQSYEMTSGDFNGDGRPDIVTYNQGTGQGSSLSILLQGTSIASPTQVNFGTVKVGSSKSKTIKLTNSGTTAFSITSIAIGGDSTDFHQINNCGSSLAAGASCNIKATFKPKKLTVSPATVNIVDGGVMGTQGVGLGGSAN